MRHSPTSTITLLSIVCTCVYSRVSFSAPVIQVSGGAESSRFVDGVNITDRRPAVNLTAEVSFDNGAFSGIDCFKSETLFFRNGIDSGCNLYLGYFAPLNNGQAISATLSRGEYARAPSTARQWDYTTAALSWHANRSLVMTVSASDNWLGRGYSVVNLNAAYEYQLSDRVSAGLEASYLDFEDTAPVSSTQYARMGLRYVKGRWSSDLNLYISDSDFSVITPFEVEQPDFSARISYRFY